MVDTSVLSTALSPFEDAGLIEDVLYVVKSGKEATVYCCQSGPALPPGLVAAKVYRPVEHRSFKNDSVYREGRVITNKRDRRAVQKRSDWGRAIQFGSWIGHEYGTLEELHTAGADVPKPIKCGESALLMEYIGDNEEAAAPLRSVTLRPEEPRRLFGTLMRNIELFLSCNKVHGDLSPFNILYWHGQVKVIDFPQAADPRTNRNAFDLLYRDILRVSEHFEKYGIASDPLRTTQRLWSRFQHGEL